MELGIDSDTALVTASSRGIGKASAMSLASEGANVVVNGRDGAALENTVDEIDSVAAGEVVAKAGDITDGDAIRDIVKYTVDTFGGLDHLVTNAGGPPRRKFLDTSDEDWYQSFDMLVMSIVRFVRESGPYLQENGGGSIVNIASFSAREAIDSLVLSNSLRMAIIGLEKTLSRELAPQVRSNAILPGPIETNRIRELLEFKVEQGDYHSYDDARMDISSKIPLGRVGQPREIGSVVAYLCSDQASFINGTALLVDGGRVKATI